MYNVSEAYKIAIGKPSRTTKIEGTLTLPDGKVININDNDVMGGTLNIDNACVNGQEFEIGSVFMGQLKFSLKTNISRYSAYHSKIKLSFFLKLEDGTWEEVPLGEYFISDAMRNGNFISITSYDAMNKFDKEFKMITNGTAYELLSYACKVCDVELGMTEEEVYNMAPVSSEGDSITLKVVENNNYETFRDFISDIAVTMGGFATIDRFGKLVIKQFGQSELNLSEMHIKTKSISDYQVSHSKITTTINDKIFETGDDSFEELILSNNLWNTGTDVTKQLIVDHIYNKIKDVTYTPTEITYGGDPAIDLGDKIYFTDVDNKTIIHSYVMTNNWTYRNTQKITSVGSNPYFKNAKSKESKQVASAGQIAEQNKIKFTNYQSSQAYTINQYDSLICQLDMAISETGTLLIEGQVILNVTKPGTFKLKYQVNGETYMFQPKQIANVAGYHLINLSYPLTGLNPDISNLLNIFMSSEDGEGEIAESDVVITIMGSITSTNKDVFDGNLNFLEKFSITYIGKTEVEPFYYSSEIDLIRFDDTTFNIKMPPIKTGGVHILGFSEEIETDITIPE